MKKISKIKLLIIQIIVFTTLLTFSIAGPGGGGETSAYCDFEVCPGGCGVAGLDTAFCGSNSCKCVCLIWTSDGGWQADILHDCAMPQPE